MLSILCAALLPWLFWDQGPATVNAIRQAGIERLYVPPDQVNNWKAARIDAEPFDLAQLTRIPVLGIAHQIDTAGATSAPWVIGNGWRFERDGSRKYYYNVPWHKATLAAAEAYAYGVEAVVHADARDLAAFGRMLAFLRGIGGPAMPALANIGIIDDGSAQTGEVLNLLARRNLLFQVVQASDPKYDLNVQIGTREFPKTAASDPAAFAGLVRQKLGDEKRLLRLYGTDVVIGRLTGNERNMRVHLINYGGSKVEGMRVRVRGDYAHGSVAAFGIGNAALTDYSVTNGATEFTIPEMDVYAVVDLRK
jgi:hypothetical protein